MAKFLTDYPLTTIIFSAMISSVLNKPLYSNPISTHYSPLTMPYGHLSTSSHGSHYPRYVWQPSFAPANRRRHRKGARPYPRRTDDLDLSDHFRRPWLHDYEPKDWKGGDAYDYIIQNDITFAGVRLARFLIGNCLLLAGLAVTAIGYLILSIGQDEKTRQDRGETSRKALRLGRRTSIHEPPTPERLREVWNASRTSLEGKLLLGSLLSDLEPAVDRSYIRTEDGTIVGRRPGIKGWLSLHCPDLVPHYKALMSYKALADKMRLAMGVSDPDSLEEALVIVMEGKTKLTAEGQTTQNDEKPVGEEGDVEPKSMAKNYENRELNDKYLKQSKEIHELIHGLPRSSLEALERALREKLSLVWMVRGRMRRRIA